MTQSSITNSRLCNYGCNTLIYWNSSKKAFVEVETGNKHFCQSRKSNFQTQSAKNFSQGTNTRPILTTGTGKPFPERMHNSFVHSKQQQTKQPTKNSIQVLKGSELEVQKQYEKLSDILTELGGKIHGSQSHFVNNGLELRIVVYYEVPATVAGSAGENRERVKQRLN